MHAEPPPSLVHWMSLVAKKLENWLRNEQGVKKGWQEKNIDWKFKFLKHQMCLLLSNMCWLKYVNAIGHFADF
jgi:hypothetical protein